KDLQLSFVMGQIGLPSSATSAAVHGQVNIAGGRTMPFTGSDVVQIIPHPGNVPTVKCSAPGYSGRSGCWYKSALGASCAATCAAHGGFNAAASKHTGNYIGKGFY